MASFNSGLFSIHDLYNPSLIKFYGIYWDVTFILTTVFFAFMLFVIIRRSSKEMGSYKWYLCHQLCWSYAFDLHMSLWKPVPMWPFYVGYSTGIYRHWKNSYIPMVLMTFTSVGMGFSIYISAMHRYVQASPLSTFFRLYNTLWFRFSHYIIFFILLQGLINIPLIFLIPDTEKLKSDLIAQNQAFKFLFETEPSMFGYDRKDNNDIFLIVMLVILVVLFLVIASIILLYFNFRRILRRNRNFLCPSTQKIQAILFRALCIQMFFAVVLLLLPITAALTLSIFGFKWVPQFSLWAITVTALHTLSDFTAIAYNVRCYRVFFFNVLQRVMRLFGFRLAKPMYSKSLVFTTAPLPSVVPTQMEKR